MVIRVFICALVCAVGLIFTGPVNAVAPLPEGNTGIASRYQGDAGLGSDPAVIFFDDFESYSSPSGMTEPLGVGLPTR